MTKPFYTRKISFVVASLLLATGLTVFYFYSLQNEKPDASHHDLELVENPTKKAWDLYLKNEFEEAIIVFETASKVDSNNAEVYEGWARALDAVGKYEEALQMHQKALKLNPQYGGALLGMSKTLIQMGKYKEALQKAEEVIQLNPKNFHAYNSAANALSLLNRCEEALGYLEKSNELNPTDWEVYHLRGICLIYLGRPEEAAINFESATNLSEYNGTSYLFWGMALESSKDYHRAKEKYEKALEAFKMRNDKTGQQSATKRLSKVEFLIKSS